MSLDRPAIRLTLLATALLGVVPSNESASQHATPRGPVTRPASVPRSRAQAAHCGNGRADAYAETCVQMASERGWELRCQEADEVCDGRDLRDATCESLGYAGGSLRCSRCAHDVSRCDPCFPGEGVTCAPLVLPGFEALTDIWPSARGDEVAIGFQADHAGSRGYYFAVLGDDLQLRASPRRVSEGESVLGVNGLRDGYVLGTFSQQQGARLWLLPHDGGDPSVITSHAGPTDHVAFTRTERGTTVLTTGHGEGGAFDITRLTLEGRAEPYEGARPLHAIHRSLRMLATRVGQGDVALSPRPGHTVRGADTLDVSAGDILVVTITAFRGVCDPQHPCRARIDIVREGRRVGGSTVPNIFDGEEIDLSLPGGARLSMKLTGWDYDDAIVGGPHPLHRQGSLRADPGRRVVEAPNPTYAPTSDGWFTVAGFETYRPRAATLVVARVRR